MIRSVNLRKSAFGKGPVRCGDIRDHFRSRVRLVNGSPRVAFQASNFDHGGCALVEQRRQFAVEVVDFLLRQSEAVIES